MDLIKQGESESLEFKKSTASLRQAGETLCAFLNSGREGTVLIGITPTGRVEGQTVSDRTLQEIAQMLKHFEPDPNVVIERFPVENDREVVALRAPSSPGKLPFLFRGRPYQRVGSTTTAMNRSFHFLHCAKRL